MEQPLQLLLKMYFIFWQAHSQRARLQLCKYLPHIYTHTHYLAFFLFFYKKETNNYCQSQLEVAAAISMNKNRLRRRKPVGENHKITKCIGYKMLLWLLYFFWVSFQQWKPSGCAFITRSHKPNGLHSPAGEPGATGLMMRVRSTGTGGGMYFSSLSSRNSRSSVSCGQR